MSRSERGSVTIWMLGLSVLLLLFGGLALDFWRGLALQRELAAVADSAAIAAASGIDEEYYRTTGEVILDVTRSRALALTSVAGQDVDLSSVSSTTSADLDSVTVIVIARLELGLLGVFVDESEPLTVRASATASPRLVP
ncbi:MAG: pilus assembly protein TadG-related protein [Acidimicrobiia bacterium]